MYAHIFIFILLNIIFYLFYGTHFITENFIS